MFLKGFYLVMGLLSLGNGVWMLASPEGWYYDVPAGVPDTGSLNIHFVRDIGLAYAISGVGFLWAMRNLSQCWPVHVGLTLFVTGHAVLHVLDIISERLPASHWLVDLPGVLGPGIAMIILCFPGVWTRVNPKA